MTAAKERGMSGGVLFANDLSPASKTVGATAGDLATRLGFGLTVLHVATDDEIETHRREVPQESGYLDVIFDLIRDRLRDELRGLLASDPLIDGDVLRDAELRVVRGEPDESILKALEDDDYDLGVIGVRSRSRVGKLVFGSTAQSVLLLAPCPIVAVPTG